MIKNSNNEVAVLKILIQNEFRVLNKKISKSDKDIEKILKRIENKTLISEYEPIYSGEDIPVISYLDT